MPSVLTFSRSDGELLQDLLRVFSSDRGSSREQWSLQAEMLVEPVAWDALWKLSKQYCKKFGERFPCIACVTVVSVDYESLTARIEVMSVQHESVTLPISVDDVPLIQLWPTEQQRETCINAVTTAEFIDLLRFFYANIWMPWDDQDDKILLSKTIEERMQLWSDLNKGQIAPCVARTILALRNSAIDTHEKLQDLDSSLSVGIFTDDDDSPLSPTFLALYAEMTAKLDVIMSKWPLYENSLIRNQFLIKEKNKWQKNKSRKNVVALWEGGSIFEFEEVSQFLRAQVSEQQTLTLLPSAEDALALEPEALFVCSKSYEVPEMVLSQISVSSYQGCTLTASGMRSCLLMLSEDCRLSDLTMHCSLVNTVIVMKAGDLRISSCKLHADSQKNLVQGIVAMSGAKITIVNCSIDNFYSGIVVHKDAQVELKNCFIKNCGVGIQMYSGSNVMLNNTTIGPCAEQCVRVETSEPVDDSMSGSGIEGLTIAGNCTIGTGDLRREVLVVQQDFDLL